jgi:hypothetical protein
MQEGPARKKIALAKREAASARFLAFKSNAFLDYMLDATPEERDWVKAQVLRRVSSPQLSACIWEFDGDDYLMLLDASSDIIFHAGRNGICPETNREFCMTFSSTFVLRYPWLKRDDPSFNILTRDALVAIFMHLKDAGDLHSCTRVSRLFHSAATAPVLYGSRLQKLMERCRAPELPFKSDTQFAPHQHYFAMLFFSCKTDRELESKIMAHIHAGNDALALYVRNSVVGWGYGPLPENASVVRFGKCLYTICNDRRSVLVDEDGLYVGLNLILATNNGHVNFDHPMWKRR